jgi:putative FmdB family regulatory protein
MPIYEYQCRKCSKFWETISVLPHDILTDTCDACGGTGDRRYSLSAVRVFQVFETRNILPDGEPVTVRSSSQLRQLEAEHHVKMADGGPPPQTPVVD